MPRSGHHVVTKTDKLEGLQRTTKTPKDLENENLCAHAKNEPLLRDLTLLLFLAIPRTLLRPEELQPQETEVGLRHSVGRDMLNNRMLQLGKRDATEMQGLIRACFALGEIVALGQSSNRENLREI